MRREAGAVGDGGGREGDAEALCSVWERREREEMLRWRSTGFAQYSARLQPGGTGGGDVGGAGGGGDA